VGAEFWLAGRAQQKKSVIMPLPNTVHNASDFRHHWDACRLDRILAAILLAILVLLSFSDASRAQEEALNPGEAFVTRFSGVNGTGAAATINPDGTVGSIIDLRSPSQPPQGQHWLNEPQRAPITARQVGQVFGVALDDEEAPNIYVTATAAFGLHRSGSGWMDGMWGEGGGPGTVYKLRADNDYKPEIFATIQLDGRDNTGAALGNIAYDRWNKQLLVSDLETGMIHRLKLSDGSDAGHYDHGVNGRPSFHDAEAGADASLTAVPFDPTTAAKITTCTAGNFDNTPECWNVADFRRRVWGLGVRQDPETGEVRVYYAIWSSDGLGNTDFAGALENEKRNSVWSIALKEDGSFDTTTVVREFFLPQFFSSGPNAGKSHAVSDISFPKCEDQNAMVLSERGGLLNLGLGVENAFAKPHESRVLRYSAGEDGVWTIEGRYQVGHYARGDREDPKIRANSSGGADFGYGYSSSWKIDPAKTDEYVWMAGDALCAPFAACFNPATGTHADGSHVHGIQGNEASRFSSTTAAPSEVATTPLQSWMVDTDINVDASNNPITAELTRNDATRIGDIAIYQPCEAGDGIADGVPDGEEAPPVIDEEGDVPPTDDGLPPGDGVLPPGDGVLPPGDGVLPPGDEIWPPDGPIVPPPGEEELPPDLEKSKTGPAECIQGAVCTFTVTITNNGPGVWSGPLFENDTLPPGSTLVNYGPQPDWLCVQAGNTVNCDHGPVVLNPTESVTLTMDVLLPPGMLGDVENCIADVWHPEGPNDDPAVIEAVEQRLSALGFLPGPIDGVLDAVTQAAITNYQNANGMVPTGTVTDELRDALFPDMAGLPGDADPTNDSDCHVVTVLPVQQQPVIQQVQPPAPPPVVLPPPPPPTARTSSAPGPPAPPPVIPGDPGPVGDPGGPLPPPVIIEDPGVDILPVPPPIIIDEPPAICPQGFIMRHGTCVRITRRCPPGTIRRHGQCVRISRVCPEGTVRRHGRCVRVSRICPPGMLWRGNRCVQRSSRCPRGTVLRNGRCVKVTRRCPEGTALRHGRCVKITRRCPEGTVRRHGRCVKVGRHCPRGTVLRHGRCVKVARQCPRGTVRRGNRCVRVTKPHVRSCPRGTVRRGNRCVRVTKPHVRSCPRGTVRRGNRCVRVTKPHVRKPPRPHRCVRVLAARFDAVIAACV
jgi:uncharacterized repeat protein (TIGR01451 family)